MKRQKTMFREQFDALRMYASAHGRNWKSQLNHDWMNGRCFGPLQGVRNDYGPTWLIRFKFSDYMPIDRMTLEDDGDEFTNSLPF